MNEIHLCVCVVYPGKRTSDISSIFETVIIIQIFSKEVDSSFFLRVYDRESFVSGGCSACFIGETNRSFSLSRNKKINRKLSSGKS